MLQFRKVTEEERQHMLPTMKVACPGKGLTQNLACLLNICCSIKEEDIYASALRIKFIHLLFEHLSNLDAIFLSTL